MGNIEGNKATLGKGRKSVEKRLRSSYIIILTILSICILGNFAALWKTSSDYQYAIETYGFAQGYVGQLGIEFNSMTSNLRSLILETDDAQIESLKKTLDSNSADIQTYLEKVQAVASTSEEFTLLEEMQEATTEYNKIKTKVITFAAQNLNDEAYALLSGDGIQYADVIKANINSILELNIEKCNETTQSANSFVVLMIVIMLFITVIAILVGLKLANNISKSICNPLKQITEAASKLKTGNLDIAITFQSEDELGVLADSFQEACTFMKLVIQDTKNILQEMANGNFRIRSNCKQSYTGEFQMILESMKILRDRMNVALIHINEASDQVTAGANQMAESAQGLAEGATEQAGAVEELTATIENVAALVENSAQAASQSYEQAKEYQREAEISSATMSELTEAMQQINDMANQIGNIIGEIEDIATQTNLLSLNAAIEAARAGEAGRGFAVVADQIRKLAADSAQSAVNTRELIGRAIQEINRGNEITGKTSEVLGKVVEGMKDLGENSKESSITAKNQAEAMKQIQQGIEQISSVVQNNSAAAEETSATSEELSAQAVTLNEEVNKFQLRQD